MMLWSGDYAYDELTKSGYEMKYESKNSKNSLIFLGLLIKSWHRIWRIKKINSFNIWPLENLKDPYSSPFKK